MGSSDVCHPGVGVAVLLLLVLCNALCRAELLYQIQEETPVGSTIAELVVDSGLKDKYPPEVLKELLFRFLADPPVNISIGASNGRLFTSGRIDREQICPMQETCEVPVDITVQPVTYFEIIKVKITITDVNDNMPSFSESSFSLSIKESASVNSSFLLPSAQDLDSPGYSVQQYEVLPDTPKSKFTLRDTKKLDGSTEVRLVLKRPLDREEESEFTIQVIAFDGGGETGTLDVKVTVLDSNDHDPVFLNSTYEVKVLETLPVRSLIMSVQAVDLDIGKNGEIIYGFSTQTWNSYGNIFGIDQESGEIYLKSPLDHERTPIYNLLVTAEDLGPDSLRADATVIIYVEDVNDNAPDIKINTLSSAEASQISEDSPIDTFVAHVSVKDPDGGKNGEVNCTLNDNSFRLIQSYKDEYQVLTAKVLDREEIDVYNLAIICRDGGSEPQISIKHLQVNVADVNDNSPVFNQSSYTSVLIENSYIGSFVAQVNATDKDIGLNSEISYKLSGEHSSYFAVSESGVIGARWSMDHEVNDIFEFHVLAIDKGSPPLTGSAVVIVTIEDVNDEIPRFTDVSYSFSVYENQPSGYSVGTVTAEDKDSPPYNSFLYSLIPGKRVTEGFILDPLTGRIQTKKKLDREVQSVYHMAVVATDQNNNALSSSCSITIYVMDRNDNSPVFTFPNEHNNTIHISNKVPKGYIITKVIAEDADVSVNAMLQYSFQDSPHSEMFTLDTNLGTLSVESETLDQIEFQQFELNLVVKDRGSPPRTASTVLNIVVNKSIPFYEGGEAAALLSGTNFIIVVSLSSVCAVIAVILIVAILIIKRQDSKKQVHKYNCRMEALRTVNSSKQSTIQTEMDSPTKSISSTQGSFVDLHHIKAEDLHQYSSAPDPALSPSSFGSCSTSPCYNQSKDGPWSLPTKDYHGAHKASLVECEVGSQHSGDGSNTDSGRGPSEEGDRHHGMKGSHLAAGGRLPPYPPPPPARAVTSTYGQPPRPAPPHPPDLRPSLRQPLGSSNNDSDLRDSSISAMNTSAEFDYVQARPVRIVSPTRDNNRLQGGGFHGNHKGSNGRLHGSSHNSPSSLDVIPERTFLANTMSEMKSVVV